MLCMIVPAQMCKSLVCDTERILIPERKRTGPTMFYSTNHYAANSIPSFVNGHASACIQFEGERSISVYAAIVCLLVD